MSLHLPEVVLGILVASSLLLWARARRPAGVQPSPLSGGDVLAALIVLAGLAHLALDGIQPILLLLYAIGLVLIVAAAVGRVRHMASRGPRSVWRRLLRGSGAAAAILLVLLNLAVVEVLRPLTNRPERIFMPDDWPDYSAMSWTAAFDALNTWLARDYAFGGWKKIDWAARHREFAPRFADAEARKDSEAYYRALREYTFSLPDGHVGLSGDDHGMRSAAMAGGYGFGLIQLDPDSEGRRRTIVHVLLPNGPAAKAGVRWGAEVIAWNGAPVAEALERVPVMWAPTPPATREGRGLSQQKLLVRAPVGTQATLDFRNSSAGEGASVTLTAEDDKLEALKQADPGSPFSFRQPPLEWRVRPDGVGYVRIAIEIPTLGGLFPARAMKHAVQQFLADQVSGVILDVRANGGGADKLVPLLVGYFFDRRSFYEDATFRDASSGRFEADRQARLFIEPLDPHFGGPVAVIVDQHCVSSCEGIAMAILRRPRGHVVGFHGTYGSFGMSGAEVKMPGAFSVEYPNGQSVDEKGVVQLDSDDRLEGGVAPDVRVPVTEDTVRAAFVEKRDVALEYALRVLREEAGRSPR